MDYTEREELKKEGREIYNNKDYPLKVRASVLLHFIIASHYWRAREAIENRRDYKKCLKRLRGKEYCPYYTLDIDHYIPHWLGANGDDCDKEVIDVVKKDWHYSPKKTHFLPKGHTSYIFRDI